MGKLFLSHSSEDKPFVLKLAGELLNEDISIWLDSWEMGIGDSLLQKIYSGIDDSDCVAVLLSNNSLQSRWVKRELTAALVKEEREDRVFVLPIKISECNPPLEIADRLYSDLSKNYTFNFENLVTRLKRMGLSGPTNPESELIFIRFIQGVHLDTALFSERLKVLVNRVKGKGIIFDKQLLVYKDEMYLKMRKALQFRIDNIEKEIDYSPKLDQYLRENYTRVQILEQKLRQGVHCLCQAVFDKNISPEYAARTAKFFCLYIRQMIYSTLVSTQENTPEYFDRSCVGDPFLSTKFCELHEMKSDNFFSCDIWPEDKRYAEAAITIWIKNNGETGKWILENPYTPCELRAFYDMELYFEYLLPQMLFKHVINNGPLYWDFSNLMIGLH